MERYQLYRNAVDAWIEAHREDYIRDLSTLIRIPSVAVTDSGSAFVFGDECAEALDAALCLAEDFGLDTENDEYYCGSALLRGEIDREFAMVGHLDVVPAGSGWDFPPFEPTLRDGQLIGRGAVDNKGAVMAAMYALRCLRELNIPLRRTIRLVMGCQEEAGMNDIPHFLEKHKNALPQLFLVCDCAFPIHFGEKGIVRTMLETELKSGNLLSLRGGTAPNSIPEQAEAVLRGISCEQAAQRLEGFDVRIEPHPQGVRISARGIAGHAASPEQGTENAIAKLVCALKDSGLLEPEAQNAVSFLDAVLGDYYGSGVGIAYGDELSGKNTLVGGLIRLENGRLRQSLNIRCAITADMDGMIAALDEACRAHGFTLTVLEKNPPLYIPLDSMHGLPLRLTGLANELLGLGQLKPAVLPGGTHTRLLPNAIGYGPNMGPDLEFKKKRFGAPHGANEAVIIQDMMDAIRVYVLTWLWLDDQPESALPDGSNT